MDKCVIQHLNTKKFFLYYTGKEDIWVDNPLDATHIPLHFITDFLSAFTTEEKKFWVVMKINITYTLEEY